MSGRSADCRKFAPNIFNKSKCTNCFRQKEEHSAEALESNRASRKISKCGYLFVAPGWDFSNPLYRTKRWQRRWFVLYDDGELTYSLDEHPDTVPQASIDMTSVVEVSDADNVTGHQHSLAITAPERVTFVKGTCREESRWWADVLSVFPRSKGRHKRNATFPGGQHTSLLTTTTAPRNGCSTTSRPRYNSCHAGGLHSLPRPQPPQPEIQTFAAPTPIDTKVYNDQPVSSASPPTRDKINGDEKARSRRDQRRDTWTDDATVDDSAVQHRSPLRKQYDEQLRDIAASLTRPRSRRALPPHLERPTRDASDDVLDSRDHLHDFIQARGSPDGGAPPPEETTETIDTSSAGSGGENGRVELPAERLLHVRAGWLQRRSVGGWARHWFVLRGAALLYFRDPQAEQRGLMDGVIDLSGVARVVTMPVTSSNGYAFETETWDGKHYILSAVTAGIRANWVAAISRTAGLPDSPCSPPPLLKEDSIDASETSTAPVTPLTPRSAPFSSDDEYRTASEGGRRDSVDWADGATQPPPSPVPTRTPISKVKDKVRARACHQPPPPTPVIPPPEEIDEIDAAKSENGIDCNEIEPRGRTYKRSYVSTIDKQSIEIDDLRERLKIALSDVSSAEKELARLKRVKAESAQREKMMEELVVSLQKAEEELAARTNEVENLEVIKRLYNQDKASWENKLKETQNFLRESTERCEMLTDQLNSAQEAVQTLQKELNDLNDKLHHIVRENDTLYSKINELETCTSPRKEKRKSIGSISELTDINIELDLEAIEKDKLVEEYAELRTRFMRAIHEIKIMKRELRESHDMYDELEITNIKLHNEMKLREECSRNEINIMAAKIQDLTQKLSASDKQVRTLKHKIQKTESREKRRSLSLKGRESFSIGKEIEDKLTELESKISILESNDTEQHPVINSPSKSLAPLKENIKCDAKDAVTDEKRLKRLAARLRRKSLDSAISTEPMKMLVRLSSLESKIVSALDGRRDLATSCDSLSQVTRSSDSPVLPDSSDSSNVGSHPQRHLLDRLQSLENIVILSRNKINDCLCQMSAIKSSKSRRSPSPSLDKKPSIKSIEKSLTEVSKTLQECFDKCVVECEPKNVSDIDDGVYKAVYHIEHQLRQKLLEISKKKSNLLEAGELTHRKNLELLAEKLAYEAVLVGRIQETLEASNGTKFFASLIKSEINETSQLIEVLQRKMHGDFNSTSIDRKNSLDYLARILSRKIDIINSTGEGKILKKSDNIIHSADVEALKIAQKEITAKVEKFKSEKLTELSTSLANETLSYISTKDSDFEQQRANIEATRVREAWAAARDVLGAELVQADVTRALARAAQHCEATLTATRNTRLTFSAQQAADLELWWQAAHHHLRAEMDVAVRDIAVRYRDCLNSNDNHHTITNNNILDSRDLLQQLAEVLAHKALIDARIAVIDGTYQATIQRTETKSEFTNLLQPNIPVFGDNIMSSLESDPNEEAEFIFLFQQFSRECRALFSADCSSNSEDLMKISKNLEQVEIQVREVQKQLGGCEETKHDEEIDNQCDDDRPLLQSVFAKCEALKKRVETLSTLVPCKHCKQLQEALEKLKSERTRGETALQQQAGALAAARRARQQLQVQHERERLQLRERARRLERRLETLDSEYSQQLDNLKTAYHNTIGTDAQGDNLRARYQAEIEQLRALCEKGLLAMESSHRRIVHEMEEKHRAEREHLRLEKEAALAEETRATLAALDAMRKAHESEVKREVDKFKAEFLGRGGSAQLSTRHQQEMEEIKQEILSLSEKYSVKCVESAALEERLVNATQQLAHAQQHIMQLDARNKQLRAHLMSETSDMKNVEPSSLAHLIEDTASHGRSAQGPLWEHLRHLATAWQKANSQEADKVSTNELRASNDGCTQDKNTICQDGKHKKFTTVTRPELSLSRCSRSSGRASLSPLVGMVAERKKRFELDALNSNC